MATLSRLVALMCAVALVSFSLPAVAEICNPTDKTKNCRGLECTAQQLGTTLLDLDQKAIIACLKSDYPTPGGGGYVWKLTTSEMGTDSWTMVSLTDTNDFDVNCQYRIYFNHGGMFPSGYLTAFSVHPDMLLTPVSSHQFALGKVKSTAKGWWYYTASGDCAVDFCFWTANKFKDYVPPGATEKLFNCEDSLLTVKAIAKKCTSDYVLSP